MSITENNIKDSFLFKIRQNFRMSFFYMGAFTIIGMLSDFYLTEKTIRQSDKIIPTLIYVPILMCVLTPVVLMMSLVKKRLIKKIVFFPDNTAAIVTFDGEKKLYKIEIDRVEKTGPDFIFSMFRSAKNRLFNDLNSESMSSIVLIINGKKFYLMPGLFENDQFPGRINLLASDYNGDIW